MDIVFEDSGRLSKNLNVTKEKKEMLTLSTLPCGKAHVKINYSSLSILQECFKKANYLLHRGLMSKTEPASTVFGSAIHKALEIYYLGAREERVLPTKFKEKMEIMGAGSQVENEQDFLILRATRGFIDRAADLSHLPPTDKRSMQAGVWLLSHYFETYLDDPYVIECDEHGPMVERRIEFTLYEDAEVKITYHGTIDAIFRNIATGKQLVVDHKTSSVVGNDFYNRLKPNHQYTGYLMGANLVLGLETDSFLVNCLQVKPMPKTSIGAGPHLPRQITKRSSEDFESLRKDTVFYVKNYLKCIERGEWPNGNVSACTTYGGCQFLEVCSSPNLIKENIISAKYEEKK